MSESDDGSWIADCLDLDCIDSPEVDSAEFDDWLRQHTYMPYVYWLPIDKSVRRWVNKNYRFNMD